MPATTGFARCRTTAEPHDAVRDFHDRPVIISSYRDADGLRMVLLRREGAGVVLDLTPEQARDLAEALRSVAAYADSNL